MYRILIAEDDDNIRKGLVKIIGKMNLPIESIYEATNGQEAVNMVNEFNPDIVVTDIKMPLLDGLKFIETAKSSHPHVKFVILSGYDDFAYAQRAITYNVMDYLLKPVKKDVLYKTLSRIIEKLQDEDAIFRENAIKDKKIRDFQSIVLRQILEGRYNRNSISSVIAGMDIRFDKKGFMVISVYGPESANADINMANICCSYITNYNHRICLLNINEDELDVVINSLNDFITARNGRVYAGLSNWSPDIDSLPSLAEQAEKALDFRLLDKTRNIFMYSGLDIPETNMSPVGVYCDRIMNAINSGNVQEMLNSADIFFDFVLKGKSATPEFIKNSVNYLIMYYLLPSRKDMLLSNTNDMLKNSFDCEAIYQTSESLTEFKTHIKRFLLSIMQKSRKQDINTGSYKVAAAIKYINSKYNTDLSLEEVAEHVNTNTSYFSHIFKKETGMCFSDFLQMVRIENSKKLLIHSHYKIFEIAEMVGFSDEKYYYKVFKKLTGYTPNQYRNLSAG